MADLPTNSTASAPGSGADGTRTQADGFDRSMGAWTALQLDVHQPHVQTTAPCPSGVTDVRGLLFLGVFFRALVPGRVLEDRLFAPQLTRIKRVLAPA